MSTRRRKKAIGKVVKLLNLATSSNSSEALMALRHAESIILQNGLSQREIPAFQLCDRMMLFKVSWNGAPRYAKETPPKVTEPQATRRFSEKPVDPTRAYANATTILDDVVADVSAEFTHQTETDESFVTSSNSYETSDNSQSSEQSSTVYDCDSESYDSSEAVRGMEGTDMEVDSAIDVKSAVDGSEKATEIEADVDQDSASRADVEVRTEEASVEQTEREPHNELRDGSMENGAEAQKTDDQFEPESVAGERSEDAKSTAQRATHNDNVIDAASAFRPGHGSFRETLRNQYASSNPSVPFEEDAYWTKVCERLNDFDETNVVANIEGLEQQLVLAKEALSQQRRQRAQMEVEEQHERSERARIELSFEEAIERAFQARAKAYEAWEAQRAEIRVASMRAEQEAQNGFEELNEELQEKREAFQQHLQLKEDYRAAKIMHELRHHLSQAAQGGENAASSYQTLVGIMSESGLSLRDLEFSDIRNKSLFIRLLERESAQISNVHDRELYTEEMLDKFLLESRRAPDAKVSENPIEQVQRLLKSIASVGQFEGQKVIEQVIRLMGQHGISVRDLDYGCINKYSVFVCLINWEAEQIHSLTERETFTASILEEYVQYSVMHPGSSKKA